MSHADEGIRRSTDYISDEERNYDSGRQKYQRERESPDGYNGREVDRFGRIRRSRSPQGGRYERSRSRSPGRDYRGGGGGGYRREGGYKGRGRYREDSRGYSSRRYGSARGDEQSSEREGGMGEQQGQDMGGVMDPFKLDLVVPFKYFCEWKRLQNRGKKLEQEELHRQYEEYRRQTLNKMYQQFFDEHKEEDWFVERYKPEEQKTRQQEVKRLKKRYYEEFLGQLERGELDNTCLDQSKAEENAMDEDAQVQETYTLFIKTIPPTVARAALESELKKVEGFDYLSLSEPNATRNYHRFGWAKFVEGTDMDSVLQTLSELKVGETTFTLSKHTKSSTAQQRTAPEQTSLPERIKSDLEVIREAVKQFDERTDSETFKMGDAIRARMDSELAANTKAKAAASKSASTPTSTSTPTPEDDSEAELAVAKKELDLSIEYLRKVHYYCYYCSAVYENREDFSRKCAPVHYRRPCSSATPPSSNWLKTNDARNKAIIHLPTPAEIYKQGGKSVESESAKVFAPHITQMHEGRRRCTICTKLFKGDEFINKHMLNKHSDLLGPSFQADIDFFNAFAADAPNYLPIGAGSLLTSSSLISPLSSVPFAPSGNIRPSRPPAWNFGSPVYPSMPPFAFAGNVPMQYPHPFAPNGPFNPALNNPMFMNLLAQNASTFRPQMRPHHQPPAKSDPRSVRSYVDLDAPSDGEPDYGF